MTRGQIAIITNDKILTSIEFNGDMYMPTKKWAGHGRQVMNALKRVNDVADYQYEVAKFNKNYHHYNDIDRLTYKMGLDTLDFTKNYFDNWFSDYVYIKNISEDSVTLTTKKYDKNGEREREVEVILEPGQIARLHFGEIRRII